LLFALSAALAAGAICLPCATAEKLEKAFHTTRNTATSETSLKVLPKIHIILHLPSFPYVKKL
jgi:hypothetical protein